jgi:hypothetical protein
MKILFCHIPKCAGTSVNDSLQEKYNENYEWCVHKILKYETVNFSDFFKFAVVRDPIERLVSTYFYQKNMILHLNDINCLEFQDDNWKKLNDLYIKYDITDIYSFLEKFEYFYKNEVVPNIQYLKENYKSINMAFWYISIYLPQYLFICDDQCRLLVDHVVDIKNIDEFMLKKFDISFTKKLNTHKNTDDNYMSYVSKKAEKTIREIYKKDYDLFFKLSGSKF